MSSSDEVPLKATDAQELVTYWTRYEGGQWLSCKYWKVPREEVLRRLVAQTPQSTMNGCKVVKGLEKEPLHAFKTSAGREWDCINGWRK